MKDINLSQEEKEEIIEDKEKGFRLFYLPGLNVYFMEIAVFWVAVYGRYYQISKDDYDLYRTDKTAFYSKYALELEQKQPGCFSSCFAGAGALRDYDGGKNFQNCFPGKEDENPFQGYGYKDGILYAHIVWAHTEIYVPPIRAIETESGEYEYPLEQECEIQLNKDGDPICYKFYRDDDGVIKEDFGENFDKDFSDE